MLPLVELRGEIMKNFFKQILIFFCLLNLFIFVSCKSVNLKSKNLLATDSAVKQGLLENGMKYYIRKNGEPKNRIVLRLVVRAGSNMEEDNQKGVAHFIEHLAFNGTEHFEKSEIINYFEKIGMDFGSDLNAYTNFDETVYKLEIPADNPEFLENALLILHDWVCAISFEQAEIDKERGVITEEWRLRQGLQSRFTNEIVPFLLKNSRYEERLPIGSMEIIKNISREEILDFYKKWYRPEFMSIVAVGDLNQDILEKAIISTMSKIPASSENLKLPNFEVPVQSEKQIKFFFDDEQKYTVINIFRRNEDFKPITTENEFRENFIKNICRQIFNQRLQEISTSQNSPWLQAAIDDLPYTKNCDFSYFAIVPKEDQFESALKSFLDECDRILTFGVTENEFLRIKKSFSLIIEQNYKNREKTQSSVFVDGLVDFDLTGNIFTSAEDDYNLYKQILENLTMENLNSELQKLFEDRGNFMFIQAPSSAKNIPSENIIMKIWTEYKNQTELSAYKDDIDDDILMERPKSKGKISSTNKISELDVNEYFLNNGIRILTKKTDFIKNQIQLYAISKGGLFLVPENEIPSAKVSVNYMTLSGMNGLNYNQFLKKISTKNINFDIGIENSTEYISGVSTNEDLESLLQIIYLIFENPQFSDEAWEVLMNDFTESAKNYGNQPQEVFIEQVKKIIYGENNPYFAPYDLEFVSKLNKNTAEKVFKERFENPADFTFVFVGDFDEKSLLEYANIYLGSMQTSKKSENFGEKIFPFPKKITNQTVYKGLDKQGQVFLGFGGEISPEKDIEKRYYERFLANEFVSLLNIRLRESIREEKSGSYGVGAFGRIDGYSKRNYFFEISFGCEPEREEELTNEVLSQIKFLQENLISQDYIEKIQESLRRSRETNLRNNNWWISRITNELVFENEPIWVSSDIEKVVNWISPEVMMEQAKKYLNTENYICVFLKPEK